MKSTWYVVTQIMASRVENHDEKLISCFEQIHLIKAKDGQAAYEKSLELGKSQEHSYKNQEGNDVYWEFVGLSNLEEILDVKIKDGTEIRSRYLIVEDPNLLVRDKKGLTIFISEEIRYKTAEEILNENNDE